MADIVGGFGEHLEKDFCECGCSLNETLIRILNILWGIHENERDKIIEALKLNYSKIPVVEGANDGLDLSSNMAELSQRSDAFKVEINSAAIEEPSGGQAAKFPDDADLDFKSDKLFDSGVGGQIVPLGSSSTQKI